LGGSPPAGVRAIEVRDPRRRSTFFTYISLAAGSVFLGTIFTYLLVIGAARYNIDLSANYWLLALPSILSLLLNVLFVELYRKFRKG
jgi:hypothetical protein